MQDSPSGLSIRYVTPCWRLPMVCDGEHPRHDASTAGRMREEGRIALRKFYSLTTLSLSPMWMSHNLVRQASCWDRAVR